jgi:Lipocalin-like domain
MPLSGLLVAESRMKALRHGVFVAVVMTAALASAQMTKKTAVSQDSAREKLIGAWHLVHIDLPGPDRKPMPLAQPKGMLLYTRDGHVSVQLMYPSSAHAPSNEYVLNGYEASFGSYDVDEATHTLTHHVQGSITRGLLVGKDLPRIYQITADGHLIIRSARPDEHWSVTWEHY